MGHLTGRGFDSGAEHSTLIDLPRFDTPGFGPPRFGTPRFGPPGPPQRNWPRSDRPQPGVPEKSNEPGRQRPREQDWLVVELNLDYVRGTMLPELLRRHLGGGGKL